MKQTVFIIVLLVVALAVSYSIFYFIMGAENDAYGMKFIYDGGPLVGLLMTLSIMVITFIFERTFSLRKANGKGPITVFLRNVEKNLMEGKVDAAMEAC